MNSSEYGQPALALDASTLSRISSNGFFVLDEMVRFRSSRVFRLSQTRRRLRSFCFFPSNPIPERVNLPTGTRPHTSDLRHTPTHVQRERERHPHTHIRIHIAYTSQTPSCAGKPFRSVPAVPSTPRRCPTTTLRWAGPPPPAGPSGPWGGGGEMGWGAAVGFWLPL